MFKKIEIWVLYLTILIGILITLAFGVLVRQEIEGITKKGNIDISPLSRPAAYIARLPEKILIEIFINPNKVDEPRRVKRDSYKQDGFDGTQNSEKSFLLLSRYDGDLKEGVVELIDLTTFEIVHTWNPDIDAFNALVEQVDEFENIVRDGNDRRQRLFHPKLTKDGGLLINSIALRKIDACSRLIFQNTHDIFHHSIETDIDGNIWVPSNIYPQSLPIEKVGREVTNFFDDAIVKLSSEGKVLYEKSVSQIFIDNGLEYLLFAHGNGYEKDPIHLNDIQPVNFDGEFWRKGDVFLSIRSQSMVLLYRPSTNEILWKGTGPFFQQHDVDILDNNRISVFNNRSINGINGTSIVDGHNEVIIYNFQTDEYSSYLKGSMTTNDVRTIMEGRSQILPNGALFIEETNFARTLYFNKDGSLRWSHVNRAENGNVYSVNWSRILYTTEDIQTVNSFLDNKGTCNE